MTFDGMNGLEALLNCGPIVVGLIVFAVVGLIILKRTGYIDKL